MTRCLARFACERRGSVATMVALILPVLFGTAAFGIDLGVVNIERRALQRAVDAAALAAVARPQAVLDTARLVMAANNQADAALAVHRGRYAGDALLAPEQRFAATEEDANAVSVTASREVPLFFARILSRSAMHITATSRAAISPVVSFAIGSRLASANPAFLDPLTAPLLGSGFGLTLLDYRALAAARVPLLPILRALAGHAGLPAEALVSDVLARPVALSVVLEAAAGELHRLGDAPGAAIVRKAMRARASATLTIAPGAMIDLGDAGHLHLDHPGRDLTARVSVLGLLSAAVTDRSIGNRLAAQLVAPGVAALDATVLIGDAEQRRRLSAIGPEGSVVGTAQARAFLRAETAEIVAALGTRLTAPVELYAAEAEARVVSARCASDPAEREVVLAVRTGIARLSHGRSANAPAQIEADGMPGPARLARTPLVEVEGSGTVQAADADRHLVSFKGAEIGGGPKTVRTRGAARSLLVSLLLDTRLAVRGVVGALDSSSGRIADTAREALNGLASPLDAAVDAMLAAAGIGLGEADVRVDDLVCATPRIVG